MQKPLREPPESGRKIWTLSAVVGPGSMTPQRYSFEIAGWRVDDKLLSMDFEREFEFPVHEDDVYEAIHDLENILLALFMTDHIPRKIFRFNYPCMLDKDSALELLNILGDFRDALVPDKHVPIHSFLHGGGFPVERMGSESEVVSLAPSLNNWFDFFHDHREIAASVGLIKESSLLTNRLRYHFRYHDYLELGTAIILLVAGLESLFTSKSQDGGDITFKFQTIGAIYYEKFVTDDFLSKFTPGIKKLSFKDARNLFRLLYRLRSRMAHGNAFSVLTGQKRNDWKDILRLLTVAIPESATRSVWIRNVLLSMILLHKHVLALICCSEDNLTRGASIVDCAFTGDTEPTIR